MLCLQQKTLKYENMLRRRQEIKSEKCMLRQLQLGLS